MADGVPVFVSHAGPDTGWAEWVAWQLARAGFGVELDRRDWSAGDDFMGRMRAAMDRPGLVVVALWSAAYFEPGRYTAREWSAATAAAHRGRCRVVPLRVEDVAPPVLDSTLIYQDLFGVDAGTARERLLDAVRGRSPVPAGEGVEPPIPASPAAAVGAAGAVGAAEAVGVGVGPRLPGVLPGVWSVPRRNELFTGRDELLAGLRRGLSGGGLRVLHGPGGMGKSSLAIEYAHRFAADVDVVWWVDAQIPALVGGRLHELAVELGAATADAQVEVGARKALDWLRRHSRWLVVFDNAEDPEPVDAFVPAGGQGAGQGGGQVLVTTRDPRWVTRTSVEVDVFSRQESVAVLRAQLPAASEVDAGAVAEDLGDLPLAVAQAAAFMAESGMTCPEYVRELRDRSALLLAEGRAGGYGRSLASTITVTLDRLDAEDPAAGELVRLLAFLAAEPVPLSWVSTAPAGVLPSALATAAGVPVALRRSVARMARYGVVRLSTAGDPVMHRLVAAVIADQFPEPDRETRRALAEAVVVAAAPRGTDDPRTWPAWAVLAPHLAALDPATSDSHDVRRAATDAVRVLLLQGDHAAGRIAADRLHAAWRDRLGADDPDTLTAAHRRANALNLAGDYQAARELNQDTLTRRRRVLGEDHPDTLTSANNLAVNLHRLGEVAAARELNEDTLARWRRVLGEDHPSTLRTANNLAANLRESGEQAPSRELNEETLARRRRVLGEDHPDTLASASNLAIDLYELGEVAAARELNQDTVARMRRVLGEDHPDTLQSASNLAAALRELGEAVAARELDEDTLARRRRVLGEDHPDTLHSVNSLALDLRRLEERQRSDPD